MKLFSGKYLKKVNKKNFQKFLPFSKALNPLVITAAKATAVEWGNIGLFVNGK